MAYLSPIEFDVGLISALNLSMPTKQKQLRQILAKANVKQRILAELCQILGKKALQPFGNAADAAAFYPGLGLETLQQPPMPGEPTPALVLAPPLGHACPHCPELEEFQEKGVAEAADYMDSGTEDTGVGTGSTMLFASEETETEPEEFPLGADARFFATSSLSDDPKVLLLQEISGMTLIPGWECADQMQRRDQQVLDQINKVQRQKQQQRLLKQQRRIIPLAVGTVLEL